MIRLGALGDVTRTLPSLVSLRTQYPGAHLCWLVERKAAGVLEGHPLLDEVLVFPREELVRALEGFRPVAFVGLLFGFIRSLRAGRFDMTVDFHAILKSGVLAWLSGAPLRVSFGRGEAREHSFRFANLRAQLPRGKRSRFDRNAALLHYLAIDGEAAKRQALPLSSASLSKPRLELDSNRSWVALHPGTSADTPYKRYSVAGYGELAVTLAKRGRRCIVTHGPSNEELELAEAVVDASNGSAELAPMTHQVNDLAALLSRCDLFVGSDSGPLHVASLVGTPVVQILGPTDPVENQPWRGTPSRSLRIPLACSPCRRGCEAATCMALVPAQQVISAALELLESGDAAPRRRRPTLPPHSFSSPSGP